MSLENSKKAFQLQKWISVIGLLLFVVKMTGYFITKSVAILTDALESIANVIAGFFSLYSLYLASQPRDKEHPYGHGKVEFISAAVEGVLISFSGVFILFESVKRLMHPSQVESIGWGILAVFIGALVNGIIGLRALTTGKNTNSLALKASGKHLLSDVYSSIGLLIGLGLMYFVKWPWLDSVIAMIFAVIILYTGIKIIRESVAGIMDETDKELLENIVTMLNENRRDAWIDIHNFRVIKYGSRLHIDCHLTLPWYYNLKDAHREIDQFNILIDDYCGTKVELFMHTDYCLPHSCKICILDNCKVRQQAFEKRVTFTSDNIFVNRKHNIKDAE